MASFPESDFQICPLCKEMCGSPAPLSSNSSTSSSSSQTSSSSGGGGGGGGGSSCGGPPRRLHVLPCLHAFCRQCLEAQRHPGAGDALKLRCPICDQKVVISEPSGMDALPSSNFLLSNLLDVVVVAAAAEEQKNGRAAGAGPAAGSAAGGGGGGGNNRHHGRPPPPHRAAGSSPAAAASAAPSSTTSSSSSSGGGSAALLLRRPHSRQGEPRCSSCDEGNAASSRCLDCQEHLCDNCVRAHQRVRLTKDHFIERFAAAGPGPAGGPAAPLALSPPYTTASPYNILSVFPDRASYCQHHDDEVSECATRGKGVGGGRPSPAPEGPRTLSGGALRGGRGPAAALPPPSEARWGLAAPAGLGAGGRGRPLTQGGWEPLTVRGRA